MALATEAQLHPFPAAMQAGDAAAVLETLAPDVVLISPITSRFRFEGRDEVGPLLADVIETLEGFECFEEFGDDERRVAAWRARVRGQEIEGTDIFKVDDEGRVREIRVFVRPLPGLAALTSVLGRRLARRRSRTRGAAMTLLGGPLALMTRSGDAVAPRLAMPVRADRPAG